MSANRDEDEQLRHVTLETARSIFQARRRAEEELVRTKEALWKQSEWLRVTLASIGDAVVTTDTEGKVLSLNSVAEELTGWTQSEAQGRPLADVFRIVNEETRRPVENPAERALREGRIVGLANHTVLIAQGGTETPIDDSAAPIRDEQGRILGVVLIFRSIAERRQAEAALQERLRLSAMRAEVAGALAASQELQAVLHRCCELLVQHLDVSFARIWTLNHVEHVLELQASAGLYTHLDGPHSRIPVGQFKIGLIAEECKPHLTNSVPDDPRISDREWARREGMVAFAGYPLMVEDRCVGVVAMFARRPLSEAVLTELAPLADALAQCIERRRAEAALRASEARKAAILETALDCIITCDDRCSVLDFNPAAERTFGYHREEILGRDMVELIIPSRLRESHRRGMAHYLATGEGPVLNRRIEMPALRADGTEFSVELAIARISGEGPPVFTAYLRDITERKRGEAAIRRRATFLQLQKQTLELLVKGAPLLDVLATLVRAMQEQSQQEMLAAIHLVDEHGTRFLNAIAPDLPESYHRATEGMDIHSRIGPCCWAALSGENVTVANVATDAKWEKFAPLAQALGIRSAVSLPILSADRKVLGTFANYYRQPGTPSVEDVELLEVLGRTVALAIERTQAEEALRRWEHIFQRAGWAVAVVNAEDNSFRSINPAFAAMHGYAPDELMGKPLALTFAPEHRDELPRYVEAAHAKGDYVYESTHIRKDGIRFPCLTHATAFKDAGGKVVFRAATFQDLTSLKRAEQTTRFLADASAALAELTDYRSTLQMVAGLAVPFFADWCAVDMTNDDGTLQRLAVTHSDPAKVQLAHELFRSYPPQPADPHGVMKVLRTGESDWTPNIPDSLLADLAQDENHLRILRELGLKSYICTPLRSRSRVLGVLTFVTAESGRVYDATDLAAAEDLARRAVIAIENANLLAALKETDRRKDEFLAMLAHELRNPLAPVRNAVQIFRSKGVPVPELQWATEVIDRQVHQMTRLVDDLLDVSRITRGKVELRKEVVDLADVLKNAIESSRPLIEKWGHELTATIPPQPIRLEADPTRLAQVFLNLLNNAAKYTDQGGRIELTAERQGDQAVVRVKDNGIGIPPEMLARVFELFAQVDRTIDRSEGGLGIGLTLVQRLVQMHCGTVEARSAGQGQGSEFVVRLPVARAPAPRGPQAEGSEQIAAAATRRMLVVDDNRDAADSLAMLLRIMGHEVHTAHDGLEAVGAAATFRPDVILLDIGLPKLNGYEAARRIREQQDGANVLLVALTGWGQEEDRRRSRDAGFDHHMTKPVEFDALQKLLARASLSHAKPRPA